MTRRPFAMAIVLLVLLGVCPALAATVRTVAQVYTPNRSVFLRLTDYPVTVEEPDAPHYTRIVAGRETVTDLAKAGFEVEVLIDDLDAWSAARAKTIAAQPPQTLSKVPPVLDHFFTNEEIGAFLADLAATYPDLMSYETIGTTLGGRPLYLVKISDNVTDNENEPAIYLEGSIHGDEIAAYTLNLHTIEWLLTNYAGNPAIKAVVDSREIFITPLTNPDGNYDAPLYGRTRYNDNGVDLNRNYGYMWDPDEFDSGPSLHSEPESQALSEVWLRSQPYSVAISGHSGTVVISLPWSYHLDTPPDWDEFDYLGEQYCNACLDTAMDTWYQGSIGMYQMSGSTKDELYGSHGAMAWSMELTLIKECDWSKAAQVNTDHEPSLLWLLQEIGQGLHGTVTSSVDDSPLAALVRVNGRWTTFTDYEVGDFHKYLRPGTYDIAITANGYLPYTDTVTINAGEPLTLDVSLTPDSKPKSYAFRWIYSQCPTAMVTHQLSMDALGRPDGEFYPLGNGGWVILDLGPDGIDDGVGDDLAVYESNTDGDEDFFLSGKAAWDDEWTLIGDAAGNAAFDLNAVGLANIRYVLIEDGGSGATGKAGEFDGYDLDAVGTPALLAAFTATPTSGLLPLEVQFNSVAMGTPNSWWWDFGDGNTSDQANPVHTYTDEGYYTVSLTVGDGVDEDTLTKTDYINAYQAAPSADFSGTPTSGEGPLEVQFANLSTGSITEYAWDFGDGNVSAESDPLHVYQSVGKYTVQLTVTGPGGSDTASKWRYIVVVCPAPTADFSADITSGEMPLTVSFTNLTENSGCNTTYLWSFGDNQTSSIANAVHTYSTAGVYTVSLQATTEGGADTETKADYITVTATADDDDNDNNDDNNDATPNDDDTVDDDDDDDDQPPAPNAEGDDDNDAGCGC